MFSKSVAVSVKCFHFIMIGDSVLWSIIPDSHQLFYRELQDVTALCLKFYHIKYAISMNRNTLYNKQFESLYFWEVGPHTICKN